MYIFRAQYITPAPSTSFLWFLAAIKPNAHDWLEVQTTKTKTVQSESKQIVTDTTDLKGEIIFKKQIVVHSHDSVQFTFSKLRKVSSLTTKTRNHF